jgi:DNA-binding GntR family transcriptional regulator
VTAAARGDLIGYLEADRRFHLALLALAGNEHLVAVVDDLRKRSRLFGLQELAAAGKLEASGRSTSSCSTL